MTDGRCVSNALLCSTLTSESQANVYNLTYTGALLDPTCPFSKPVRCIDGACVATN